MYDTYIRILCMQRAGDRAVIAMLAMAIARKSYQQVVVSSLHAAAAAA